MLGESVAGGPEMRDKIPVHLRPLRGSANSRRAYLSHQCKCYCSEKKGTLAVKRQSHIPQKTECRVKGAKERTP